MIAAASSALGRQGQALLHFEGHISLFNSARRVADRMNPPAYLRNHSDGVLLAIKLQPRASANQIAGPIGAELKIKVTAPPVDSAANEALVQFLAQVLDCRAGSVELVRGHTSRHKLVKLHGMTAVDAATKLAAGHTK